MTPDEQNDALRAIVDQELPRPMGGFESTEAEQEWIEAREARFFQLVNDEKTNYLYAFEDDFRKRCLAAKIDPSRWKLGLWANAHMYHGMGLPVTEAVDKWFQHVAATESRKALRSRK